MPPVHSSPFYHMENPAILILLRHSTTNGGGSGGREKRSKSSSSSTGGLLKMFKLFPMLTSGCKMVALLGRPRKPLLKDSATTGTIFGYRKGRVSLAIQEGPYCMPIFVIELPMHRSAFHKEMQLILYGLLWRVRPKPIRRNFWRSSFVPYMSLNSTSFELCFYEIHRLGM
ncbi:hypothetical protein FNV43_RR00633 [Rhamnella rubrinervis]|uniref:Uncharacterized protein n=1 Tax=Rhamnella rubrinervis TaxID=2594499 RepID=A0A8K0MSL2_9ROSA|nr:hypothetical protein FNV43_RR00633 [Rhamnella rubrinervis]